MNQMYEIMEYILKHCNNKDLDKLVTQYTKDNKPIKCVYMVLDELKTSIKTENYKNKSDEYNYIIKKLMN